MSFVSRGRINNLDRVLLAFSIVVLAVYLFYTLSFIVTTPYPGIAITSVVGGWQVNDSSQPGVPVEEMLVQIGDLTYEEYRVNKVSVPFEDFEPGDIVPNLINDEGESLMLRMPHPSMEDRLRRLVGTLWFFPFWLAGTAVLLFLRPRDLRWRLIIAFMYLAALWAVVGSIANWQIGGSQIVASLVAWLMVPIVIHLHLTVPSVIFEALTRRMIPLLYAVAVILAVVEVTQQTLRLNFSVFALALAVIYSVTILVYRSFRADAPISDRNSARLMLAGIGLAFGPGILVLLIPQFLGLALPTGFGIALAFISLPIFPISYTYAIYKRQLGQLEFRANRLLGLYSFILVYPTLFIVVLLFGDQWMVTSSSRTFYFLIVSIIFVMATPPILNWLQSTLNRLAYGTEHDPDDILHVFAKRIPSALSRRTLAISLQNDILPALLIRQSALLLYEDERVEIVYAQRLMTSSIPDNRDSLKRVIDAARHYRPATTEKDGDYDWVRLAIPLVTRDRTIGAWLLGRRDPDDYYPQNDIELLQTLANQITPVIENIRLYEEMQQHAEQLSDEVARRTAELREEKDRTQAILDSAGEGVFFTDPAGTIMYANKAMAHQSGFSAEQLRGKSLELWQNEDQTSESTRELWTAIYTGREWGGELQLKRKDDTFRDVNLVVAPIQAEDGQLSGFVGVQSDISKLKEVDRVKSNIISSVSHELKTPLTTIKTYLALLQRGKPEKKGNYLTVLNREADRLAIIIEDLLDLSALEAGKISSKMEPVEVTNAIDEVVRSCQALADSKRISVSVESSPNLPLALVDNNQLGQVLTNLLVNALNYSDRDSHVSIETGPGLQSDTSNVWIKVSDNGPGISNEDLPHLFDRFYRGEAALESGAPGTGLGLAICKEIIERHQGRIEVHSTPGEGATFKFWLPAIEPSSSESRNGSSGKVPYQVPNEA